jgi:hypothetical protein
VKELAAKPTEDCLPQYDYQGGHLVAERFDYPALDLSEKKLQGHSLRSLSALQH